MINTVNLKLQNIGLQKCLCLQLDQPFGGYYWQCWQVCRCGRGCLCM